jgi:hypothetical protein
MGIQLLGSSPGLTVFRDTQRRDGIRYEIAAFAAEGGIYGRWQCRACGIAGINPVFSTSKEEAINLAIRGLGEHHSAHHTSIE